MESVIIYRNYLEIMDTLLTNDSDWREAMTEILKCGFDGTTPKSDNPSIQTVYLATIPTIKSARKKYIQKCTETPFK